MPSGLKGSLLAALVCFLGVAAANSASAAQPQTPSYTLDQVLSKMDAVSKTFKAMEGNIERLQYNFLAEQNLIEDTGKLFIARQGKEARLRYYIKPPHEQNVVIDKGKVQIYMPKEKKVDVRVIDPSHQQDIELLLVGFGQSAEDIRRLYEPSLAGTDIINGKKTVMLDLKPKGSSQSFTSIRLWLDPERWVPVRTRIVQPSKDIWTIIYKDVKVGPVSESTFEPKFLQK